jgi:vancomycin aglycone glucosyltransferase
VQTGACILPGERPLPAELVAFLDAGTPPAYVGFGGMRRPEDLAPCDHRGDPRPQDRRVPVAHGWADLALITLFR